MDIRIDKRLKTPVYLQIVSAIKQEIAAGAVTQERILPSERVLAKMLGVHRNTVAKAYQELERQGIIYTVPGRGSFVSPDVLRLEGPNREALQEVFAACDRAVERGVNPPELLAEIERHLSNPSQGGNGHD